MRHVLSECEFREINRIREIMMIEESEVENLNFLNEARIGSMLAQELWAKIKNGLTGIRNNRDFSNFTDDEWDIALRAIEADNIDGLPMGYQKTIAKLVKLKFADFIPKIHENVLKIYYEKYPGETYRDFISLLSTASKSTGKDIGQILRTGGKNKGPILVGKDGNPDYFAIDLIAPRLEKDVQNFRAGKEQLEYEVAAPPRPNWKERTATRLDSKLGKYKSVRAFYDGVLRGEPGSKYFRQMVVQNAKNISRRIRKKELLNGLTSEQKKVATRWFITGVADWRMVDRYRRQLGWPYMLPNIAGQIFRKWLVLSAMMSVFSVVKSLVEAAPETAEKMEVPEALLKRVLGEFVGANPGITSPLYRMIDIIFFTVVLPAIRGRSEYKQSWDDYWSGRLERINTLIDRTESGENVQDEDLNKVLENPETPDTTAQGIPLPNPNTDSLRFDSTRTGAVRDSTASSDW